MTNDLDGYLDALSRADAAQAITVLDTAASRGVPAAQLIREVLVPAQRRVGELWFTGAWSIADEHAASAVSEQALSIVCRPTPVHPSATRVVLACAEGEWHTLPARLAQGLVRTDGLDVTFVGGSMPAEHLARHLRATSAEALALSCTMPTNLLGAARSIEAAHDVGIPVVVGGRAWGEGGLRAQRLGADRYLDDPAELSTVLAELRPPRASAAAIPSEALLMDVPPRELLLLALERQRAASSWLRDMTPYQVERSLEDLRWLARHAAAAVACEDESILRDLLHWCLGLLTPRGVPAAAVVDGCDFLADALEPDAPLCARTLRSQAAAVRTEVGE